jgi:hypothetical protein
MITTIGGGGSGAKPEYVTDSLGDSVLPSACGTAIH